MALAGILEIQLMADIARLSTDLKRAEQQVHASTDKMGRSVATLESAFGKLGSTLMLGAAFEGVRRLTDDYTKLTAQIRIATHGQAEYANGLAEVRRISTESQASITATGALYTRLTNSLGAYGATQKQVANITETVSLGLKAYGATSVEASSAMLQLSQAFASNRLGGDEFRAMMESMPNMMRTLAKSMNVPFEALKVLSAEGKITAKEMMKAWDDPALIASLQKQANMTRTITGEITVLRNNVMMLVGEFMGASGSTAGITTALRAMSDSVLFLGKNLSQVITLITVYVGYLALMGAQSVIEWSKARLVTVAHTQALVADAIGKKAHAAIMTATAEQVVAAKLEEAFASQAAFRATLAETQALLAGTLAANERAAAELRLAGMTDRVTAAHAKAIVMERERTITMVASNAAEGGRTAALAASSAGAIRWGTSVSAAMAMIGTSVSAAVLANPIGLAVVAIGAITLAIVEWETVVKASKATFNWFSETIDALVFGAKAWSISLGEVFALIEVGFLKDTGQITLEQSRAMRAQIKADAEQSTIDLINLGHEKIDHEKLAAMERYANDRKEWEKLTNTKEQRRQTEIESLKEHYRALVKGQVLNKEQILANEERYAQGLAIINEKYGKDAVRAAKARAKELSEEEKARAKFEMEVSDARQKYADDLNRETKSIEQKTAAVLLETESIGKTKAEIDMLQASRYDHETQLMRETLATYESAVACTVEAEALKEAIKARETYKKAQTDQSAVHARQAAIEAESKAVKKLADEERKANEKLWHDIDKFAHTAFDNIFDKGKNAFEELGKVIQKSILDLLYQMTVKKWVLQIGAAVTGGTASGLASAATGDLSGMGGLSSLFGSSGTAAASSAGWTTAAGQVVGGYGGILAEGGGLTAEAAASTAAMAGGEAGAASAMSAISTAMPYLAAAYVAYSLLTQDHGTPTSNTGNAAMQFNAQGGITGKQTFYGGTNAATDATITGMQTAYMQAAMNLGIGTVATQFRYGGNTGENGQHPNFALGGGAGRSSFYQSETTLSDAAVQLAASRAVFAALQGSQLPQYLKSVFEGLSIGTMSQAQIDNTLAYAQSLKQLRDSLLETRTPLEIAQAQVMDLTGALHTSADTFKTDFVAAIDAGINPTTLARWQSLGTAIDQVTKATAPLALNLASATDYFTSKIEYDRLMGRIQGGSTKAPTTNAELLDELKAMRLELAALRDASDATAKNTRQTADTLRNVSQDGVAFTTVPA